MAMLSLQYSIMVTGKERGTVVFFIVEKAWLRKSCRKVSIGLGLSRNHLVASSSQAFRDVGWRTAGILLPAVACRHQGCLAA